MEDKGKKKKDLTAKPKPGTETARNLLNRWERTHNQGGTSERSHHYRVMAKRREWINRKPCRGRKMVKDTRR